MKRWVWGIVITAAVFIIGIAVFVGANWLLGPVFQKSASQLEGLAEQGIFNGATDFKGEVTDADATANTATAWVGRQEGTQPTNITKKIIKNADAAVEVKDSEKDFQTISGWVAANGGYEFNRSMSFDGRHRYIRVVYKLPPDKLNVFLEFLEGVGNVKSSNTTSDDITDQYYDTTARLENLKKGREQLLQVQEKAKTISDILKVQNELNRITGEIESLQGRINMWDKLIAESTVNLSISEEADPMRTTEELSWKFSSLEDILKTAKNGFIWTSNTLVNLFVWTVIGLVSVIPVIIILAIVVIVVRLLSRNKKK